MNYKKMYKNYAAKQFFIPFFKLTILQSTTISVFEIY